MSHESPSSGEMVTVLVVEEPTAQALAESVLREAGVPFAVRNAGVQHLVGGGQIGGVNVATGPPRIQVAASDALRANTLLREAFGPIEPEPFGEDEEDTVAEVEARALTVRYARYSAVWAVLALWGVGSLLGVFFGIQALRRSRGALTLTKGLIVVGLGLGLLGVVGLIAALWNTPHMPEPLAYLSFL
jgi:Putative prokaryotic signal transducing protein